MKFLNEVFWVTWILSFFSGIFGGRGNQEEDHQPYRSRPNVEILKWNRAVKTDQEQTLLKKQWLGRIRQQMRPLGFQRRHLDLKGHLGLHLHKLLKARGNEVLPLTKTVANCRCQRHPVLVALDRGDSEGPRKLRETNLKELPVGREEKLEEKREVLLGVSTDSLLRGLREAVNEKDGLLQILREKLKEEEELSRTLREALLEKNARITELEDEVLSTNRCFFEQVVKNNRILDDLEETKKQSRTALRERLRLQEELEGKETLLHSPMEQLTEKVEPAAFGGIREAFLLRENEKLKEEYNKLRELLRYFFSRYREMQQRK